MTKRLFVSVSITLLLAPLFASAAACPNLYRNLSFGSRGQDVIELQNFLIAQGDLEDGLNTGYFGRLTESAVKNWQAKNGIVSNGTPATTGYGAVGPKTRAAIMRACLSVSQNTFPDSPTASSPSPFNLSVQNTFALTAAWAGNTFGSPLYATPIGWGYMDPMVVIENSNFYVPVFYPCDDTKRILYCLNIFKKGTSESIAPTTLFLGYTGNDTPKEAYQTPMIFDYYGAILATYWYLDTSGISTIAIDGLNTNLPYAQRKWGRLATYKSPGKVINYLGAAMARDGSIYIAGWGSSGTQTNSLELLRSSAPNFTDLSAQTVIAYDSNAYVPLYPQVAVKNDGKISILFTLQNNLICPQFDAPATAYKIAAQYEGYWGGQFNRLWQDTPADSLARPETSGSNCNYLNARFPLDLIYSPSNDSTYAIVRVNDIENADPYTMTVQQKPWTQKFTVWKNASILNADISSAFAPIFSTAKDIHAMSMTQLRDGTFVIFANNRSTLTSFAAVATKDFKTFSPPLEIPAQFGAGHSIKVGQGYKNTPWGVDKVIFYHSGRYNDSWTDLPNYHLQFLGGEVIVQ